METFELLFLKKQVVDISSIHFDRTNRQTTKVLFENEWLWQILTLDCYKMNGCDTKRRHRKYTITK